MKKKIMTFTMAALFTVNAAASFAGSHEPLIRLVESGEQGLHLYMDSLTDLARLSIFDGNGVVLFRDNVKKRFDFRQKYDMSELPDGSYTFEIESGNRIKKYSFVITQGDIEIDDECEAVYKPTIVQNGKQLDVSYLNLESGEVSIFMYDPNGKQILNKDLSGVQSVGKRFDLSKLDAGIYKVVVRTPERTFSRNVGL